MAKWLGSLECVRFDVAERVARITLNRPDKRNAINNPLLQELKAALLEADDLKSVKGLGGSAKRSELIAVLELARRAMGEKLRERPVFDSPDAVKQYLQLHIGPRPHEVFAVVFLDVQHRMLALEEMFRGTLTQTSVYPREVVTRAIHHHAAAVVLAHNHPSGSIEPSRADESLTQTLRAALALVDVRVLDHIIVSPGQSFSMAEKGLL